MTHTNAEAQNFASRAGQLAPLVRELYTLLSEMEFNDQDFVAGTETIAASDFVGSAFEGYPAGAPLAAYTAVKNFLTTNRAVLVRVGKFK